MTLHISTPAVQPETPQDPAVQPCTQIHTLTHAPALSHAHTHTHAHTYTHTHIRVCART